MSINISNILYKLKRDGPWLFIRHFLYEIYLKLWMQKILKSYSQGGEDLVIDKLLNHKNFGFYVDIGASDPSRFNNTKKFYDRGWSGINIEPEQESFNKIVKQRKRDINLNIAIGPKDKKATLFIFQPTMLSTISTSAASKLLKKGYKLVARTQISIKSLSSVFNKYCKNNEIDFISIDTEGHELNVLESNNWKKFKPKVICIESAEVGIKNTNKPQKILNYLQKHGYKLMYQNINNSIFLISFMSNYISKNKHYSKQKRFFEKDLKMYEDYRQNLNAWRLSYIQRIEENLLDKNIKGKTLIDIGTGSGYVALAMAKKGLKVYACDITSQAIKNLNLHKKNLKLNNLYPLQCFAEEIPLPNESVDYIFANAILEHIPEEEKAIKEWKRILKKGGKMFIVVPLKFRYIWPIFWPINYLNNRMVGHLRRYDREDLKRKFALNVKKIYYTGHFAKTIWVILSRLLAFNRRSNSTFDSFFEILDKKKENNRYGASNITVVFEKR